MLQSLDVISVNLWQILISLANLLLLFLLVKKFLFKPVQKILDKRANEINSQYEEADVAVKNAQEDEAHWKEKLNHAEEEAADIVSAATDQAKHRSDTIISDAKERAQFLIKQAEADVKLTYEKSIDQIKREMVDVSGALTEKLLEREIKLEDHRNLIDTFIEKIGDNDDRRE